MKTQHNADAHEALHYHSREPRGKIATQVTKPMATPHDLALAYSPGVAYPVLAIADDRREVNCYTNRANRVAIVTNGTAVLGLGDRGPEAAKPVMEGKCMLLKGLADVDAIDLEVNERDPDRLADLILALEPSFGAVILEDVKSPDCFYIEHKLNDHLSIPLLHDDQHGTAVVCGAAVINGLKITGKRIEELPVVICGAGAAAIGCAQLLVAMGLPLDHLVMVDSLGVITRDRPLLSDQKRHYATARKLSSFAEAMVGADLCIGVSTGGLITPEMVARMADRPMLFALANPTPELPPHLRQVCRADMIYATGLSDQPNQVNNVLGFPYILRGALDVEARRINEVMRMAAAHALAALAEEEVTDAVRSRYPHEQLRFGPDYLLPKALDERLLERVASAVAEAAVRSGEARLSIDDWDRYRDRLRSRVLL